MFRQRGVLVAGLAILFANTGCVACCHKTYQQSWRHGADCDVPTPCRSQVYVLMIHGLTPSTECGLEALRVKLGEQGFAKVGVGELIHTGWVEGEIKSILKCEPEARFVLIGYDLGGPAAMRLARDLSREGVPVEAVVLLDPMGKAPAEGSGVRTVLITAGTTISLMPHTDRVVIPDATHFTLPANPQTVAVITELLKDIAISNCQPVSDPIPFWSYEHAPAMRELPVPTEREKWNFLADYHGPTLPIGTRAATVPANAGSAQRR